MASENDKAPSKAEHPIDSRAIAASKPSLSPVNDRRRARVGWKLIAIVSAIAVVIAVSIFVIIRKAAVPEAVRLNQRGLEKFGRHDYLGAIVDFHAALNEPDATNHEKSASLYFMATSRKALGDIDGAIGNYLDVIKLADADVDFRCMAGEDVVPQLLERAGKRFGNGDIFGAAEDYEALSSIENVPPELKTEIAEGLKKLTMPGSIVVETNPPGATIAVDGAARWKSPSTIEGIVRGTHEITAVMAGYRAYSAQVIVNPASQLRLPAINLERTTGTMEISVNAGGKWTLVGRPADASSKKISGERGIILKDLPTGEYSIEFSREGWTNVQEKVVVEDGKTARAAYDFVGGTVSINMNESGASWEICALTNGLTTMVRQGNASTFISDFPPGVYIVKFIRTGWPQSREMLYVEAGKVSKINYTVVESRVTIESEPSGASITDADGKTIGKTPFTIENVVPGAVRYDLNLEGFKAARLAGDVQPGKILALSATLEKEPPAKLVAGDHTLITKMPSVIEEGSNWIIPSCDMEMTWIAGGSFVMGASSTDKAAAEDEKAHKVTISSGYWIGKYEVTMAQWKAVMSEYPKVKASGSDNTPARGVTWNEAVEFCRRLTIRERSAGRLPDGYAYVLPTEARWEFACRAGTATSYSFGNDGGEIFDYGNTNGIIETIEIVPPEPPAYSEDEAIARTFEHGGAVIPSQIPRPVYGDDRYESVAPVGSYRPNAFGLCDMHGNVWEWCIDFYGGYPVDGVADPAGPEKGSRKVCRGGSWKVGAQSCRSSMRHALKPSTGDEDVGLRVALVRLKIGDSNSARQ
jgi:formylglycine-generating enzyme required for sulfatase activity